MGSSQGCCAKDHGLVIYQVPLLSDLPPYSVTSVTGEGLKLPKVNCKPVEETETGS